MNNLRDQIEPYLLGELSVDEEKIFRAALDTDQQLFDEVEQTRHIIEAIEIKSEARALEALHRISSEQELIDIMHRASTGSTKQRSHSASRWIMGISAAAVIVIAMMVGMQHRYDTVALYDDYFVVDQHIETPPSRGGDDLDPNILLVLHAAHDFYSTGDYHSSVSAYASVLEQSGTIGKIVTSGELPQECWIYYSLSLNQTGETNKAIEILRTIANDNDAELQDIARWNLSLILLKQGERESSQIVLSSLIENNGEYAIKAMELKDKINQRKWF